MRIPAIPFILAAAFCCFADIFVIDTFSFCRSRDYPTLPCDWGPFQKKHKTGFYTLERENESYYVKHKSTSEAVSIGKPVEIDIKNYSRLSWRWRVHALPAGGDERNKKSGDSGASVYVVFKGVKPMNNIIKYVWSTTLPVGTLTQSPHHSRTKIVVLRSGEDQTGIWVEESVDLLSDYIKLFSDDSPPMTIAFAIMSDGDDTNSYVEADYAHFLMYSGE
ncbi:MAG: DUF3047 domain-containing protein [Chitinispirillales bacterium]|jgi:hypothetical protein|nr:DUF3047 domain-containing protein [Chitinispirillales bacterium]